MNRHKDSGDRGLQPDKVDFLAAFPGTTCRTATGGGDGAKPKRCC
jgi:hypothetical protein